MLHSNPEFVHLGKVQLDKVDTVINLRNKKQVWTFFVPAIVILLWGFGKRYFNLSLTFFTYFFFLSFIDSNHYYSARNSPYGKRTYNRMQSIRIQAEFLNLRNKWNVWHQHQKYENKKEGFWNYLKYLFDRILKVSSFEVQSPGSGFFLPKPDTQYTALPASKRFGSGSLPCPGPGPQQTPRIRILTLPGSWPSANSPVSRVSGRMFRVHCNPINIFSHNLDLNLIYLNVFEKSKISAQLNTWVFQWESKIVFILLLSSNSK